MITRAAVLDNETKKIDNVIIIDDSLINTFLSDKGKTLIQLGSNNSLDLQIGDTFDGTNFYRDGNIIE
jgi:hypothetical protein